MPTSRSDYPLFRAIPQGCIASRVLPVYPPMQRITPSQPNAYTGGTLDRAAHRRNDEAWIQSARRDQRSRFVLFWRGNALITGGDVPKAALGPRPDLDAPWVFLGLQDADSGFCRGSVGAGRSSCPVWRNRLQPSSTCAA